MNSPGPTPIFDGHNDALLRLWKREGRGPARAFLDGEGKGQLDLPMAVQGGFAGGMFAIFVPSPKQQVPTQQWRRAPVSRHRHRARRCRHRLNSPEAQAAVLSMASILIRIEREAEGRVRVCRTVNDIRQCIEAGVLAAVLHIEGAEAIDPEFETLDVLHQAGLRSLGPVWSRSNMFGHGVPFRCPSSPDPGPA